MNRTEPKKPPRMVNHSVDASCLLNICIPAKTNTDRRLESTRDVPVFTAAITKSRQNKAKYPKTRMIISSRAILKSKAA